MNATPVMSLYRCNVVRLSIALPKMDLIYEPVAVLPHSTMNRRGMEAKVVRLKQFTSCVFGFINK